MPSTCADLDLSGEWCITTSGENFILANDGDSDKIVIFGTENALQHLFEADTFVDGTLSICPYALLSNKQRSSYNRAYMLLKDAALDLGLTLDPVAHVRL